MDIYRNILHEDIKTNENVAVALGKFDGLHRGHRALISMLEEAKKKENMQTAIFTFVKSPREVFDNEAKQYILTADEKRLFMEANGIDILVECPLEKEILSMEPEVFIKDVLVDKLSVNRIYCGEDFRFGYGRKGDVNLLKKLEEKYDYKTTVIKKLQYKDRDISSTYIREEIALGNVELTNELLGYPYTVIGVVQAGAKLGRTIGFPTVNLIPEKDKLLLPNGVYFTNTIIDGKCYNSITNIGTKPTVNGSSEITIETNIMELSEDLYDKVIEVRFFEFIRAEVKFNSIEELKNAVAKDIEKCRLKCKK